MQKKYGKETIEFQMFQDYWKFIQEFAEPEPQDEWWKQLHDESVKLSEKYHSEYMNAMLVAYMEEVERRAKQ